MANTWVPGYLAEVTIGADSLEGDLGSGTLTLSKNLIDKPVAGDQKVTSIAGLIRGTMSVSGHISVENWAKFNTAFESNAVVAYVWQIGEDGGGTDVGEYAGNMLVENLSGAFDADDEFSFSMDCKLQTWTYTDSV
jgi:hypothetical protein